MSSPSFLITLGLSLLLSGDCPEPAVKKAAGPDRAAEARENEACTPAAWSSTLKLGTRNDAQSERRLHELRAGHQCPHIRKLAEVLLDDREPGRQHRHERPVQLTTSALDLESIRGLGLKNDDWGHAQLVLTIDADGRVAHIEFLHRHWNEKLNALYLEHARKSLFRPARDGDGYKESKMWFSCSIHRR